MKNSVVAVASALVIASTLAAPGLLINAQVK